MLTKQMRLKLASMLRLYKQVSTDNGLLIVEAEDFIPGEEVFIQTEDGEIIPANDATYSDGTNEYVVVDGKLAEVKLIEKEPELPTEEKPAEEKPAEEKPAEEKPAEEKPAEEKPAEEKPAEEKPAEDSEEVKALKEENEALKAKVEELEAKVQELTEKIKEYEEKEKETDPSAEDAEKFSKQKEDKYAKVMTRMSYLKK